MTLTIELTREDEVRIRREAAAHGLDAQEYIRRTLVERAAASAGVKVSVTDEQVRAQPPQQAPTTSPKRLTPRRVNMTPDQKVEAFRKWSNSSTVDVVLPDEAFERENLYEDRD